MMFVWMFVSILIVCCTGQIIVLRLSVLCVLFMVELMLCPNSLKRWHRRMQKDFAWHEAEVVAGRQRSEDWIWIYEGAEAEEQAVDDRIKQGRASRTHWSWVGLGREPEEDDEEEEWWAWEQIRSKKPKWMCAQVKKKKMTKKKLK